jgi:GNAT superfamily N-acetyltransferase
MPVIVRRIEQPLPALLDPLAELLIDAVHGGASVGFLASLSRLEARAYWLAVFAALGDGLLLWVAESDGRLVGTVQLGPCLKANGRHRGELMKLLVHSSFRGRGISSRLCDALDAEARARGLTLLVLDTIADSASEAIYRHRGWQAVGQVPDYAAMPGGELRPTVIFYRRL